MMKSSAAEKPSACQAICRWVGSGSCVSLSALPAMKAEAKVRTKRRTLSNGGRSAPSVPGPGGGGGRSCSDSAGTGSTREPFPRLAEEVQPEARLALQPARNRTLRPGFSAAAEERVDLGEIVVDVGRPHAE